MGGGAYSMVRSNSCANCGPMIEHTFMIGIGSLHNRTNHEHW